MEDLTFTREGRSAADIIRDEAETIFKSSCTILEVASSSSKYVFTLLLDKTDKYILYQHRVKFNSDRTKVTLLKCGVFQDIALRNLTRPSVNKIIPQKILKLLR